MKRICCFFDDPVHYRKLIYNRIEESYDCDWYFEVFKGNFKKFDTSHFKSVSYLPTKHFKGGYTVKGLLGLLFDKRYTSYLMSGLTRNVSLFLFLLLKRLFYPGKKVFLWSHGYYGRESKMELFYKHTLFYLADGIFLYGNHARMLMIKDGLKQEKLHVIHNSLNYDVQLCLRDKVGHTDIYTQHFGNNNPVLLFIGRLNQAKRLDMLVESLASLKLQGEYYNLVLIGDGDIRSSIEELAAKKGLSDNIWFYGPCYDDEKNAELIFNADLCVSPGNVGLTAIHVMMFGCPCVSHDNFAYQGPEFEAIKEGITGAFYKQGDQDSLTSTISQWFKIYAKDRNVVRQACYQEIDTQWNPDFQLAVIKPVI